MAFDADGGLGMRRGTVRCCRIDQSTCSTRLPPLTLCFRSYEPPLNLSSYLLLIPSNYWMYESYGYSYLHGTLSPLGCHISDDSPGVERWGWARE